jgi:drug/metabolite transporter (DMT)-like permease
VNTTRATIAVPFFFAWAVFVYGPGEAMAQFAATPLRNVLWLALSMISSYALGDFLFLLSTRFIGVAAGLALASTYPLWSAVAGWMVRGEAMTPAGMSGLVLIVAGVILVILGGVAPQSEGGVSARPPRHYTYGILLGLAASVFWSLNTFATSEGGQGVPMAITNTYRMFFAATLSPILGLILVRQRPRLVGWADLKKYGWVFFIESIGGTVCYMYGLTHASLAVGASLSSLSPAIIAPVAWIMKWERFSWLRFAGILAIVFGIVLLV